MEPITLFGGPLDGMQLQVNINNESLMTRHPADTTKSQSLYKRTGAKQNGLTIFAYKGTEGALMTAA